MDQVEIDYFRLVAPLALQVVHHPPDVPTRLTLLPQNETRRPLNRRLLDFKAI